MENLLYFLPIVSILISLITLVISFFSLKNRMLLENKIRNYLIDEISKKNLDLKELRATFKDQRIKIEISSEINEDEVELYKKELDECVTLAIKRLQDNEQIIIKRAIDNSTQNGRSLYKDKVISDSISKVSEMKLA